MPVPQIVEAFEQIGANLSLGPFGATLQPLIEEMLQESGKAKWRKGTVLMPRVVVWLVVALNMRRALNCRQALNWLVSGFRWLSNLLPAKAYLVAEGTISHARVALGRDVFRRLWEKFTARIAAASADFHGYWTFEKANSPKSMTLGKGKKTTSKN